jgi:succinate dehydrogenase/fumarate reductase flavoprotein subunit
MREKEISEASRLSRRGFICAAVAAGAGLAGCSSGSQDETGEGGGILPTESIDWTGEADVIVMGFGGAGGTAAIEAARQGSSVLLFEKAPQEYAGGNTSICEGASFLAADRNNAFEVLRQLTDESSVTDVELYSFIDNNMREIDWFQEALGMECTTRDASTQWGRIDTSQAFPTITMNPTFYTNIADKVSQMKDSIEVFYETPVVDLIIAHPENEIRGVVVEATSGERKNYKAKRGVIMACGSFEANHYLLEQYCYDPLPELYPIGTPYNSGDGIPMVQKAGARLRHMAEIEFGAYCFRKPTQELGTTIAMNNHWPDLDNLIAVNKTGKRFMNEALRTQSGALPHPGHDKSTFKELEYDGLDFEYENLPFWFIFDDTRCKLHALATWASSTASSGWTARHKLYDWSADNQVEIEKGWIIKADTIAELAVKIGVDAATLEATVNAYNASCEAGSDLAFGRSERLTPIIAAPFYATEMVLAFINVQGGPQRNEEYQVIDCDGKPIPRLFAAGEFGSIWGRNYHGGLNVPEAMCGFAAGESVAALEPWV